MKRNVGWIKRMALTGILALLCIAYGPGYMGMASDISAMDGIKIVPVNTPYVDLLVSLAPGFGVGQWEGGVPVSLGLIASEDVEGLELPDFPDGCENSSVLKFINHVSRPEKVLETTVFPVEELFEGLRESTLYRLTEEEEVWSWQVVAGWPQEEPEELLWAFSFEGAEEAVFLLCGVSEVEPPQPELSGTDWQLFWSAEDPDWWKSDAPILTFDEGSDEDPGALYFTITSPGDWESINSLDLYLYFDGDPSEGFCLFHRVAPDGEWVPWDLGEMVEFRPGEGEDEEWLGEYGFRVHMTLPNELIEDLADLNDIQFRLGSCVIPVVVSDDFDGQSPFWKLIYRACDEGDASVDLIPFELMEEDLDVLDEDVRELLLGIFDKLHAFELDQMGCIDGLWATFWFECDSLAEGERYYLWTVEIEGEEVVLTAVSDELISWIVLDEPEVIGELSFSYRLRADLSEYPFDGDTLFILAPVSPEDLEPGSGESGEDGGGGGGGCSVAGMSPFLLLLVPLGLLFRR